MSAKLTKWISNINFSKKLPIINLKYIEFNIQILNDIYRGKGRIGPWKNREDVFTYSNEVFSILFTSVNTHGLS